MSQFMRRQDDQTAVAADVAGNTGLRGAGMYPGHRYVMAALKESPGGLLSLEPQIELGP